MAWNYRLRRDAISSKSCRCLGSGEAPDRVADKAPNLGRSLSTGLALAGGLVAPLLPGSSQGEMVFGYYPGYEYSQMAPDQIDWAGINCVIHFAADPNGDGTVDLNRFQLFPSRIEQMVHMARDNEACVLLTIGGANTKWAFAEATAAPTVRAKLVDSIVDAIVDYGYDGVDIDWEPLQDSDEAQFTALIRELRAALDARAPGLMLTAAVPFQFGTKEVANTASIVAGVADDVDFVHLMAYALAGPWGGWVSWHNSALYNGGETFPGLTKELPSGELMVEQYFDAGVPYEKMTLGLAFFGKIWQGGEGTETGGVTAPRQSWTSKPTLSGEYQYHQLIARSDFQGNDHWDDVAKSPYLGIDKPGSANDLFIPYEDPRSIEEKVRYAAARGLGGVMIWELRGDYQPGGEHPLIAALKDEYQAQYGNLPGDVSFDPGGSPPDPVPGPDPTQDPDPPAPDTMHVADLDNTLTLNGGKKWQAAVQVTVADATAEPVAGASVAGRWSIGANAHCKTDGGGQCSFPTKSFSNAEPNVTFSVTMVGGNSLTYAPADNQDPEGDSDGTSITIVQP